MAAATSRAGRHRGFTLIELLVAITIMALMAVLGWRGLDGMLRAQAQTSQHSDELLTLQAGLVQWKLDLDKLVQIQGVNSLEWDGRVLRLSRQASPVGDGVVVVAWTRRPDSGGQWLRWQSPAVYTTQAWRDAWGQASAWAQSPGPDQRTYEVLVVPLKDWQITYFRGNTWTNALSSDGNLSNGSPNVPEGIRLVLTLPDEQGLGGKLTIDWVRPDLSGNGS
ncbi:MAG: prepilin-type N-terminal cleavage/methylation domain-containing protein [Polaromonas sp.]